MQIEISQDQTIQMLTEPGIIGKIGLNSHGIGTCLNILLVDKPLNGVPIHIVLRAILDTRTIEEAKAVIRKAGCGKASNILFGDHKGDFYYVEFAGDETCLRKSKDQCTIHTNHYLERPINPNEGDFRNSYTRFQVAQEKASRLSQYSIDDMKALLTDRSSHEYPIWREYKPDDDIQDVGTVATIIMDLKAQKLHVRKGNVKSPKSGNDATADQNSAENLANDFVIAFEQ